MNPKLKKYLNLLAKYATIPYLILIYFGSIFTIIGLHSRVQTDNLRMVLGDELPVEYLKMAERADQIGYWGLIMIIIVAVLTVILILFGGIRELIKTFNRR